MTFTAMLGILVFLGTLERAQTITRHWLRACLFEKSGSKEVWLIGIDLILEIPDCFNFHVLGCGVAESMMLV
ncbi:hypothetical protein GE21DRAFT_1287189 [Neurospora crassa]|nr:hypothetical protein GE21DRAFT_1287189 [Neurospora crassa]